MGQLYTHSLSTDGVDKYNYKWMVMLLLLLSLASFIIPLHPSYQTGESTSSASSTKTPPPKKQTSKSPQVQVYCWCPSQFEDWHVAYANAYCKNAFLAALRGDIQTSAYEVMQDTPISVKDDLITPLTTSRKEYFDMKRQEEESDAKREDLKGRVQKLVTFEAPIMLLLAAILLTLPHAIWSLLSACCGSFNVDQTLRSASTNRHVKEEISASITTAVRTCPNTMSLLYLVKKIMSVVVVLVLLIVVCQYALPTVEELDRDLSSVSSNGYIGTSDSKLDNDFNGVTSSNGSSNPKATTGIPPTGHHYSDWFNHPNNVFLCEFQIRQMGNIHRYSVQCSVRLDEEKKGEHQITTASSVPKLSKKERNLLELESFLLKIVTAVLAIMTVGNVGSLCAWVYKLVTSTTAMDIAFLVQMARLNTSADVAHRLAQSSSGKDEGEMMSY